MISITLFERINRLIQGGIHLPTARQKHFSFIVKRAKIVSFGWCQSFKTHPIAKRFGHRFDSIHSELHCIKNFPYPVAALKDYTLINVRVNPNGSRMTLARPCIRCIHFLSCFNLKEIVYTDEKGEFVKL